MEYNWSYFAGFGFPAAVLGMYMPKFIDTGGFAFLFPVFLILAIVAKPRENLMGHVASSKGASAVKRGDEVGDVNSETRSTKLPSNSCRYPRLPIFHLPLKLNVLVLKVLKSTALRWGCGRVAWFLLPLLAVTLAAVVVVLLG